MSRILFNLSCKTAVWSKGCKDFPDVVATSLFLCDCCSVADLLKYFNEEDLLLSRLEDADGEGGQSGTSTGDATMASSRSTSSVGEGVGAEGEASTVITELTPTEPADGMRR